MGNAYKVVAFRDDSRNEAAIVFIHGGGGGVTATWGKFPRFLSEAPELGQWDIYCVGYRSRLMPGIPRYDADPEMRILADWFRIAAKTEPLKRYKCLTIIAHSLGGLVIQRALLDNADLCRRVGFVFMFGTSSNGFSGWWLEHLMKQVREIRPGGPFIDDLRLRWKEKFIDRRAPFRYLSIAGTDDDFVQNHTALDPFPKENREVVAGNHRTMVRPDSVSAQSVQIVIDTIMKRARPSGPLDSARVAVEMRDFERAITDLEPHKNELDEEGLVMLALAYCGIRQEDAALALLKQLRPEQTDAIGVLAGRLKRRWLKDHRAEDGMSALSQYRQGLETSIDGQRWDQAFYHGINVSFMELAKNHDLEGARRQAREVLKYCRHSGLKDKWRFATEGEAHLLLNDTEKAVASYKKALATIPTPKPHEVESMYMQAGRVANLTENHRGADLLDELFKGPGPTQLKRNPE